MIPVGFMVSTSPFSVTKVASDLQNESEQITAAPLSHVMFTPFEVLDRTMNLGPFAGLDGSAFSTALAEGAGMATALAEGPGAGLSGATVASCGGGLSLQPVSENPNEMRATRA